MRDMRKPPAKERVSSLTQGGTHVMYEIVPTLELLNRGLIVNWMTKIDVAGWQKCSLSISARFSDAPSRVIELLPEL